MHALAHANVEAPEAMVYRIAESLWVCLQFTPGRARLHVLDLDAETRASYDYAHPLVAVCEVSRLIQAGDGEPHGWCARLDAHALRASDVEGMRDGTCDDWWTGCACCERSDVRLAWST